MSNETNLLPCPFCNSAEIMDMQHDCDFWIQCAGCNCSTQVFESEAESHKAWNTRAVPAEEGVSPEVMELISRMESDEKANILMAVAHLRETGRASISALQRHLKISYGKACRLMEELELNGVVTGIDSHGHREVISEARP